MAVAFLTIAASAAAQTYDILQAAEPTGLRIETDVQAALGNCDWYFTVDEFLEADLEAARGEECEVTIDIFGVLNQAGADRFEHAVAKLGRLHTRPVRIELNSRGGDTDAAFRFASTIRRDPLFSRVDGGVVTSIGNSPSAVCFSACIIVFAAGFVREAEFDIFGDPNLPSRLGIHRPAQFNRILNGYQTDVESRQIRVIKESMKRYFAGVSVSEQIVDDMFAVPFDDIHLISRSEAVGYGLIPGRPVPASGL